MKHENIPVHEQPHPDNEQSSPDSMTQPVWRQRLENVWAVLVPLLRKVPVGVWILFAGFFIYNVLVWTAPTINPVIAEERSWPVSAVTVSYSNVRPQVTLYGAVIAGREVEMRSLVAGQVVETGENFREGGIVQKDELLIQIDPFDYQAALDDATARRREARARLKNERDGLVTDQQQLALSERDLERAQRLHEKGTVSRKFLDDSELANSRAQQASTARVNRIEIEAARLQQHDVAVRRAERDLEHTSLRAPFTGYVRDISAELGKRVTVNDRVAYVSDSARLEVRFSVTDAQYGRILASGEEIVGRQIVVSWNVGDKPLEYTARVERIGAKIDAQSGGIDLYAQIDAKPDNVSIRPGAFVEISFPDREYINVVQLPESTLFGGTIVYVIVEDRLEARQVNVVGYAGDDVFLQGEITEGEAILTTRFAEIGEGVLVDIRE